MSNRKDLLTRAISELPDPDTILVDIYTIIYFDERNPKKEFRFDFIKDPNCKNGWKSFKVKIENLI